MTALKRQIRPFTPAELNLDEAERALLFWRLRRYSSLVWARRATELLQKFIGGFDGWARKAPATETLFARKALQACFPPLAALEEAPSLLLANQKTRAYDAFERAGFLVELKGPGFNDGITWLEFGYDLERTPSTGLFAWADRALEMCARMKITATGGWAITRLLAEHRPSGRTPVRLELLPDADGPIVACGEEVAITGVYLPVDVPGGCPNFLVEGRPAPVATVETTRVDTEAWPGDAETQPRPATTMYVYEEVPTRWRLAWEDRRYRAGVEPDEEEFLDVDTDLPPYPPVHPQPS